MNKLLSTLAFTTMLTSAGAVMATDAPFDHSLLNKILVDDATVSLDLRYRYEYVDQAGFAKDANASTLRTKLGYKTGKVHGFQIAAEIEDVTPIGSENYNNTVNGKTAYPIVADPDVTQLNHLNLSYTGVDKTTITLGRQGVNLDNQRFVGTVGFRQNDQTYDAITLVNSSLEDTTLVYGYVNNVNRIQGDDHILGDLATHTHLINAAYSGLSFGKLSAYSYLIDLERPAVYGLSTKTFGARFNGKQEIHEGLKALYTAEYASQSDYADNATDYRVDYYNLEAGLEYEGLALKGGFESLGSDNAGTVSFSTPLATGHKFNGWADKFLTTPATGLEDIYASAFYSFAPNCNKINNVKIGTVYHDFASEYGNTDFGTEWDAIAKIAFLDNYSASVKYANYRAEAGSGTTDIERLWFTLGAKF